MMTRTEHLEWCKKRAHDYLAQGDVTNAVASMMSDMNKHPETASNNAALGMLGLMAARDNDLDGARRWIDGWR